MVHTNRVRIVGSFEGEEKILGRRRGVKAMWKIVEVISECIL